VFRLLIVEDDAAKLSAIAGALAGVLPNEARTDTSTTAAAARRQLEGVRYDLVVLDIALPRVEGAEIDPEAGTDLLNDIVERSDRYISPTHVLGLTGFPEVLARARARFASHLVTLSLYEPASDEWADALRSRVRHVLSALRAVDDGRQQSPSALGIVCALPLELSAVLALPWQWAQVDAGSDHTIYWRGTYNSGHRTMDVYACLAARMGMPAAACVASKLVHTYRPKYLGMVGIAAGVRPKVSLGDLMVADPCWDWGSGKWICGSDGAPSFQPSPYQIGLDPWLRERFRLLAEREHKDYIFGDRSAMGMTGVPKLHIGPVATGAAVLADEVTALRVSDHNRQLLGIEMEGYGVLAAAQEAAAPRPLGFLLKAVVDFADGGKNDDFQPYGASVAARALQRFAETYL
jgi:nucleoside phosphorylase/CheY-like chemotaxis protein